MRTIWLVLAVLFLLVGPALAKPKVAVIAFEGDKKGEAREMVSDSLSDSHRLPVAGSKAQPCALALGESGASQVSRTPPWVVKT